MISEKKPVLKPKAEFLDLYPKYGKMKMRFHSWCRDRQFIKVLVGKYIQPHLYSKELFYKVKER